MSPYRQLVEIVFCAIDFWKHLPPGAIEAFLLNFGFLFMVTGQTKNSQSYIYHKSALMTLSIFTGNVLATSRLLSTRSHPRALQTNVTRTGLPSICHIFPKTFNSRFGRSRGSFSRFSAEIYVDTDYCSILRRKLLNQELRFGKRFEEVTPKLPCHLVHGEHINSKYFKLLIY